MSFSEMGQNCELDTPQNCASSSRPAAPLRWCRDTDASISSGVKRTSDDNSPTGPTPPFKKSFRSCSWSEVISLSNNDVSSRINGEPALSPDGADKHVHTTPITPHISSDSDIDLDLAVTEYPSPYSLTPSGAAPEPYAPRTNDPPLAFGPILHTTYSQMEVRPSQQSFDIGNSLAADLILAGGDAVRILNQRPSPEQAVGVFEALLERATTAYRNLAFNHRHDPLRYGQVASSRIHLRNVLASAVDSLDTNVDHDNASGLPTRTHVSNIPKPSGQAEIINVDPAVTALAHHSHAHSHAMGIGDDVQAALPDWASSVRHDNDISGVRGTGQSIDAEAPAYPKAPLRNATGNANRKEDIEPQTLEPATPSLTGIVETNAKQTALPKSKITKEDIKEAILSDPKREETRFVLCFKQNEKPEVRIPSDVVQVKLNPILRARDANLRLLYARWNARGNLVLGLPYATATRMGRDLFPAFVHALSLPPSTTIHRDLSWSKVLVFDVPTGALSNGGRWHPNKALKAELLLSNPCLAGIDFAQEPRWIAKTPAPNRHVSSFVFAFEDPMGHIIKEVLAKKMYLFATEVKTREWTEKPLLKGCARCLSLDHFTTGCARPFRCDVCAGSHATGDHRRSCAACKEKNKGEYTHPPKCANCSGVHMSTNNGCPKREVYRKPVSEVLRKHAISKSTKAAPAVRERRPDA